MFLACQVAKVECAFSSSFAVDRLSGAPYLTIGSYEYFVKASRLIILAVFLVGCAATPQSTLLTTGQANTAAVQLANDKASTLYHCQPFRDDQSAQFVAGRWLWIEQLGFGHGDIRAR